MSEYKHRRPRGSVNPWAVIKVCPACGYRRCLANFPYLAGEKRRADWCGLCLKYGPAVSPSLVVSA